MLNHIYIRDFAIIEELDLELQSGMTVLTGETGAGKSILIDAIGLVLGDRTDSGVVRHGSDKTEITLSIDISATPFAAQWLKEQSLEHDDECILRRVITSAGKSRAWINGSPSNLGMLRQLGEQLVDIHGQHEHQSLMKKDMQRQMLDDYADNQSLLNKLKKHFEAWKTLSDHYQTLSQKNNEHTSKVDLLRFQTQELEQLDLAANEVEQLNEEHRKLANAEQLLQATSLANQQLYEGDNSIYSSLTDVVQTLEQQVNTDQELSTPLELVTSAQIHVQEAAEELRHYLDRVSLDPERLSWVENRIADIQTMARKHHVNDTNLPSRLLDLQQELTKLESDDYDIDALKEKLEKSKKTYLNTASKLTTSRSKAAIKLSDGVTDAMQTLSMKGGKFSISLTSSTDNNFSATGLDNIQFEVSANPGQPLKPLVKVASGGELSRISLAIQMIAAQKVTLPALIFDEVDTGIGGATAEVVGQQLRKLGTDRQVLCVTHLPQVAALCHHHYKVTKIKQKKATSTGIMILDDKQRIEEIARMTGGVDITDSTRALAKEMIGKASN